MFVMHIYIINICNIFNTLLILTELAETTGWRGFKKTSNKGQIHIGSRSTNFLDLDQKVTIAIAVTLKQRSHKGQAISLILGMKVNPNGDIKPPPTLG